MGTQMGRQYMPKTKEWSERNKMTCNCCTSAEPNYVHCNSMNSMSCDKRLRAAMANHAHSDGPHHDERYADRDPGEALSLELA